MALALPLPSRQPLAGRPAAGLDRSGGKRTRGSVSAPRGMSVRLTKGKVRAAWLPAGVFELVPITSAARFSYGTTMHKERSPRRIVFDRP
jgi:hypothetical protein